jgi:hypothetical protein
MSRKTLEDFPTFRLTRLNRGETRDGSASSRSFSNLSSFSATLPTQRKPRVSATNWADWSLAADAQVRMLRQSSRRCPTAFDRPDARPGHQHRRSQSTPCWIESEPEAPEGDLDKDFGSFKICGHGSYPKTFLIRGQAAKAELL